MRWKSRRGRRIPADKHRSFVCLAQADQHDELKRPGAPPDRRARRGAFPVQPQRSHDRQGRQVGAQDDEGGEEGGVSASSSDLSHRSSRSRCSSTPPTTVTIRVVKAVETLLWPVVCRPQKSPARRSRRRPRRPALGTIASFPAFVTSVSAKFTLVRLRRHSSPGRLQRQPSRKCQARNSGRIPDLGRSPDQLGAPSPPATRSPRSRTPNTGTRRRGGGSPPTTTSTIRFVCATGTILLPAVPRRLASAPSMPPTSTFLVEIDGHPLPRRRRPRRPLQ